MDDSRRDDDGGPPPDGPDAPATAPPPPDAPAETPADSPAAASPDPRAVRRARWGGAGPRTHDRDRPSEAVSHGGPTAPVPTVAPASPAPPPAASASASPPAASTATSPAVPPSPPVRTPPPAPPTEPLHAAVPAPTGVTAALGEVLLPDASTPVLEAAEVGVRDRSRWLVRGLDLRLGRATVTWLVTLDPFARDATALALAGRLAVDEGHVHVVDPHDATRRSGRQVRRVVGIGWVPRLRLLEDRSRVAEVVRQAYRRAGDRLDDEAVGTLLDGAGLEGAADVVADDLPASQKALLGLVVAAAGDPPVVVAPFPSGSTQDRDAMTTFAERLARDGSTVLVVTAGDFRPPDAGPRTRILGRAS